MDPGSEPEHEASDGGYGHEDLGNGCYRKRVFDHKRVKGTKYETYCFLFALCRVDLVLSSWLGSPTNLSPLSEDGTFTYDQDVGQENLKDDVMDPIYIGHNEGKEPEIDSDIATERRVSALQLIVNVYKRLIRYGLILCDCKTEQICYLNGEAFFCDLDFAFVEETEQPFTYDYVCRFLRYPQISGQIAKDMPLSFQQLVATQEEAAVAMAMYRIATGFWNYDGTICALDPDFCQFLCGKSGTVVNVVAGVEFHTVDLGQFPGFSYIWSPETKAFADNIVARRIAFATNSLPWTCLLSQDTIEMFAVYEAMEEQGVNPFKIRPDPEVAETDSIVNLAKTIKQTSDLRTSQISEDCVDQPSTRAGGQRQVEMALAILNKENEHGSSPYKKQKANDASKARRIALISCNK